MLTVPTAIDMLGQRVTQADRDAYDEALKLQPFKWSFSVVSDVFKQLLPTTDESTFDYLSENMGRLHLWQEIHDKIAQWNSEAPHDTHYKLFILARHGQGYHNLANLKYGEKVWNEHWLRTTGDGDIVWAPDPELTELGIAQAAENNKLFKTEIASGMKVPSRWYSSPFRRSADTLIGSWKDIVDLKEVKPHIKEDFRETLGVHLCDKRSPRSVVAEKYEHQGFIIEEGFEEEDIYFKDDYREPVWEQALRQNRGFQHVFDTTNKEDDVINVTSHSCSIKAQLLVLGHRHFTIGTGGLIPVVVKGVRE